MISTIWFFTYRTYFAFSQEIDPVGEILRRTAYSFREINRGFKRGF
ncbi:hypothetical protein LEP1GSC081_3748 [Leptospira kirschneri str. H1]|uniref:Uncharacterized protein n=1 Tax=Leptospira kirschneri str. H1 TaxID=1049966 RepID=A0A0E2B695_9LEPT|nr:hypothetical protein LEP1GSC081_3748 [Leptospira kirschneri str. H1]